MRNLKKVAVIFAISIIVLSVFNLSNAATGVVNTPAVRVREKASTDSEVLTKAYEGEKIEILGEEGDWYKVKINGKTGYARKDLIKEENETTKNNTSTLNNSVSTYETPESNTVNEEVIENNTTTENTEQKNTIKEDVSLKLLPNFASNDIKLLTKGQNVELKKELNNWVEITINDVTGWILKNKLGTEAEVNTTTKPEQKPEDKDNNHQTDKQKDDKDEQEVEKTPEPEAEQTSDVRNAKGKINVETANVRVKADKSSPIIAHLDNGDEVTIVEEIGDWYKITNSEVSTGYVAKHLVTISDVTSRNTSESRKETNNEIAETSTTTANGLAVVEFAKKYLGTSYVLGGKTPETGFDCSGYTRYVFKNFGYSLGTVAAAQDTVGTEVSRDELKEGDLILFYDEGKTKIGHTGIYIGGDQFIHAANPQRGVVIDGFSTNSYYSTRFVTARRIVE